MACVVDENVEEVESTQSLIKRVYYAARDGIAITLFALLSHEPTDYVNYVINRKIVDEDGQRATPLLIAARHGHDKVVKILLQKFKPDLEQEGVVKFDGYVIKGASALWCAAAAGHLNVVKTLVKAGANVNHPTSTNSSPVRAACFDGHLDIIKYLMDHSADIHIANNSNNTSLMIAVYRGHPDIVNFLLEHNADPNVKEQCGATALHYAAEFGHCSIASELLRYGAVMTKNERGITPLLMAAERAHTEVVECLALRQEVTKKDLIDAYELLGASYASDKDRYCLTKAYEYLHKAMNIRFSDPNDVIYKELDEPIVAYENWRECETLEKLESIKNNDNALHMESLAIRERILGPNNPEVPHTLVYRGAIFADNARFDRCVDLWIHALRLRQQNDVPVVKDLLNFAQIFSQMLIVGANLEFSQVMHVLEACILELSRNKGRIKNPDLRMDVEQHIEEMESSITSSLYILTILTKLLTHNENNFNDQDIRKAYDLVHKLCALRVSLRDGQTLLHLAVNYETPVDDFHTNDVCKFPCAATTKMLIRCGADVNAMDNKRNTPLHIIVGYSKSISDFMTLHSIILDLIEAGAHMDIVNSDGRTPYDVVTTGVADIILRTQTTLSLKCIAAKAVKAYNLSYHGQVPQTLESFIELHGPGPNQE